MIMATCGKCGRTYPFDEHVAVRYAGRRAKCQNPACDAFFRFPTADLFDQYRVADPPRAKSSPRQHRLPWVPLLAGIVVPLLLIALWQWRVQVAKAEDDGQHARVVTLLEEAARAASDRRAEDAAAKYAAAVLAGRRLPRTPETVAAIDDAERRRADWERRARQERQERLAAESRLKLEAAQLAETKRAEEMRLADARRLEEIERRQAEQARIDAEAQQRRESDLLAAREREEAARRKLDANAVLTPEQIVERSERSVALIRSSLGSGTGFVVAPNRLVTNHHVIAHAPPSELGVIFPSAAAREIRYAVRTIVYTDREADIAVLEVNCPHPPLPLADAHAFRRGQSVMTIGNPSLGEGAILENAVSVGIMSTETRIGEQPLHQLSMGVNPGNSGGPVFDDKGRVIGVVTSKARKQENIAFSIPLESLREHLKRAAAQSSEKVSQTMVLHTRDAAVARVYAAAKHLEAALRGYLVAASIAVRTGGRAADGFKMASETLDADVLAADRRLTADVLVVLDRLCSDRSLDAELRLNLELLRSTHLRLKESIGQRFTSPRTFVEKTIVLEQSLDQVHDTLSRRLGFDLDETGLLPAD